MKQRSKLREWLWDHFEAVIKAFPQVCPCDLRKGIGKADDNALLFIYGYTLVQNWPEEIRPPHREGLDRLLAWGYDQDDLIAATLWMQLNAQCEPDQYIHVHPIDVVDPSRN